MIIYDGTSELFIFKIVYFDDCVVSVYQKDDYNCRLKENFNFQQGWELIALQVRTYLLL